MSISLTECLFRWCRYEVCNINTPFHHFTVASSTPITCLYLLKYPDDLNHSTELASSASPLTTLLIRRNGLPSSKSLYGMLCRFKALRHIRAKGYMETARIKDLLRRKYFPLLHWQVMRHFLGHRKVASYCNNVLQSRRRRLGLQRERRTLSE